MMLFTESLDYTSRRSPVVSTSGMVAASQPLAVAAGLEILSRGGNAAAAAVAAAAVLNVTEPTSTGIGGDCFALYYNAATRQVAALNGSGRAPAALTLERLKQEGFGVNADGLIPLPPYHPYTITVPGACAGWCDLVERYGQLPMSKVLAPAIRLAEEGFPVSPLTAYFWQRGAERQLKTAPGGLELTIEGRGPRAGEIFRNPGLARTFREVAYHGPKAFYRGAIAEAIASAVQAAGGCLSVEDLKDHRSTWEQPISTTYRHYRVWECPPNGQGLAALLALNILEGFDLAALHPLSVERLHLEIEAMRLAFADTRAYVADPAFHPAPLDWLLSKEYAAERRKLIDPQRATLDQLHGVPLASSDTVYLSVVDGQGNACSFINSNYMGFGTGIVPPGWGFSLQNRGHNFSLDPTHPNALAPGKRPYHTIIPALATHADDDALYACFGVMGGFMQPQGHLQVFVALVDDGLDPQAALDRPRFCITDGMAGGSVGLEDGIPDLLVSELEQRGHPVTRVVGHERALFGRGQIILRDRETGVLWGGSDPRSDGQAGTILPIDRKRVSRQTSPSFRLSKAGRVTAMKKFLKENWVELAAGAAILFGAFLLIDPGVRRPVVQAVSQLANSLFTITKGMIVGVTHFLSHVTPATFLGLVLIGGALVLILWRIRYRFAKSQRWTSENCPKCDSKLVRLHRSWIDRIFTRLFLPHAHRYRCVNHECGWNGLLHKRSHHHLEGEASSQQDLPPL